MDIKEAIAKAADRIDLSEDEAKSVMEIMLSGEATQAQIAAFLTALRMKGETLDELVGLASVLRDKAETIAPEAENYVDLVGTGGDCTYTFNVSTTSAFVVAGRTSGCKARKPFYFIQIRRRRCAGGTWC